MIRIDADHHVILYISHGDHMHRYAVPEHWTCSQAACGVVDDIKRRPYHDSAVYTLAAEMRAPFPPTTTIGTVFVDGDYATVAIQTQEG